MDSPEHSARFDDWLVVHRGIVFKVARSYAAQPADEAELVQEILVQLWRSASGFKGQCSVVTWIYRVSLNTALMWQRGQRRRHAVMESTPTPRYEVPAPEPRSGWTAEQAELLEQLYAAIRSLSPAERMIVLLSLDGLSYREIGEVSGISENSVGVALTRARQKLTLMLEGVRNEL